MGFGLRSDSGDRPRGTGSDATESAESVMRRLERQRNIQGAMQGDVTALDAKLDDAESLTLKQGNFVKPIKEPTFEIYDDSGVRQLIVKSATIGQSPTYSDPIRELRQNDPQGKGDLKVAAALTGQAPDIERALFTQTRRMIVEPNSQEAVANLVETAHDTGMIQPGQTVLYKRDDGSPIAILRRVIGRDGEDVMIYVQSSGSLHTPLLAGNLPEKGCIYTREFEKSAQEAGRTRIETTLAPALSEARPAATRAVEVRSYSRSQLTQISGGNVMQALQREQNTYMGYGNRLILNNMPQYATAAMSNLEQYAQGKYDDFFTDAPLNINASVAPDYDIFSASQAAIADYVTANFDGRQVNTFSQSSFPIRFNGRLIGFACTGDTQHDAITVVLSPNIINQNDARGFTFTLTKGGPQRQKLA